MKEDQIRGAGIVLLSAFAALTIAGLLWSSQRLGDERQRDNAIDSLESAGTQVGETRQVFVQPGWRLEQIARALDEAGASGERFMELTVSPQMLSRIASDDFMPRRWRGTFLRDSTNCLRILAKTRSRSSCSTDFTRKLHPCSLTG